MCVRLGFVAGRPSKLTLEVQQTVVEILRNCGTHRGGRSSPRTHGDIPRLDTSRGAGHLGEVLRLPLRREGRRGPGGSVRGPNGAALDRGRLVEGPHARPGRQLRFPPRPDTGEILRDAQGRPEAELADEYKEPNSSDARWFLERRAREDFGNHEPAVTVNMNPAPLRRDPGRKERLDLFRHAVQILVDNGMQLPEPALLEHHEQKPIETRRCRREERRPDREANRRRGLQYSRSGETDHCLPAALDDPARVRGCLAKANFVGCTIAFGGSAEVGLTTSEYATTCGSAEDLL